MKNIRKGVFETNSSSTHSVHIDESTDLFDTSLLPNSEGVITLTGGEFGWEWDKFNDASNKANYAAIQSSGVIREMLEEALKSQTGAKSINYRFSDNYDDHDYWAYIDHQSTGMLNFLDSVEKVRNFIFNPNCWLFTGNDNGSAPVNFKDLPIHTEDGMKPVDYEYVLNIEGIKDTAKVKRNDTNHESLANSIFSLMSEHVYVTTLGMVDGWKHWDEDRFECSMGWMSGLLDGNEKYLTVKNTPVDEDDESYAVVFPLKEDGTLSNKFLLFGSRMLGNDVDKEINLDKKADDYWEKRRAVMKELYPQIFSKNPSKYIKEIWFTLNPIGNG